MIKPTALDSEQPHGPGSCRGCDVWDMLEAAAHGDVESLRKLLAHDPNLLRAEYWYTQPIHLAVREGRIEAVRLLLEAGADPSAVGLDGDDLKTTARDRGHLEVARLLEGAAARLDRVQPAEDRIDHPIHLAADANDASRAQALLDAEPELLERSDAAGGTPLHRAVAASAREVIELLLERGADIQARHGAGPGRASGYAAEDFQPIDLALWTGPHWNVRGDLETAHLLLERGAERDLIIAAAVGDAEEVEAILDRQPERIAEARPSGKRALSAAVELGQAEIAQLLLARGADPNWSEGASAPGGAALHAAARAGDRALVELLLAHGADPNGAIDASGSATYAARTPELRALLRAHGGRLDPYDLIWLGDEAAALRLIAEDPRTADAGCGGALAAACSLGRRELLSRLLEVGVRVPDVLTECRSYLLSDPEMLRTLLASGMDPDLPNWQHATPLHALCGRDSRGRARPHRVACTTILLEAGAAISARDEHYRSTPLAWAARTGLADMVELLLARGAKTNLVDDEPWATPLAWASRRQHEGIVETLRAAGASA